MRLGTLLVLGALLLVDRAIAGLTLEGILCGEKRCTTLEYCSPYDKHCRPCSAICDPADRNYQPLECASDCQEYLHDQRYVLRHRYDDLRGEIARLWIFVAASIALALLSLAFAVYLLASRFARSESVRRAVRRAFAGKWIKSGSIGNASSSNNNNNNDDDDKDHRRPRGPPNDAESGAAQPNGLRLAMPTISATVAAASRPPDSESGIGNATPNTTTTTLSGRHPSEDTTLDYAYDNPAMTPSPETVQQRAKRESSF